MWISENIWKYTKEIDNYTRDIYLPIQHKEQTVFYYKHWIYEIENLQSLLEWKDIVDCGAYIGDSAMMFSKEIWFW